jgi:hypothetical protein
MVNYQQHKKKKIILLMMILASSLWKNPITHPPHVWLGWHIERKCADPSFLAGKGAPGCQRRRFKRVIPIRVWLNIKQRSADSQMKRLTRMSIIQTNNR